MREEEVMWLQWHYSAIIPNLLYVLGPLYLEIHSSCSRYDFSPFNLEFLKSFTAASRLYFVTSNERLPGPVT